MLQYRGVIVADSVGMGKTYIALRMIDDALARGWRVTVIVPATLRRKWRTALATIDRATGDATTRSHVELVSHSLVHRSPTCDDATFERLVVVDEAHQFRNPRTARYRALARITAHSHVLLLTATPINNRPADLYWLLRLFLGDGGLSRAGIPDLRAALLVPAGRDDELMRRAARAVVVRRTRADYASSHDDNRLAIRFPRRHAPRAVPYQPDDEEKHLLREVERVFAVLRLTAFDVPAMHNRPINRQTAALVRYGLLKRLESSGYAFRMSLLRLLRFLDAFADALPAGHYVRPSDVRLNDPLQLSMTGLLARPLPRGVDRERLTCDIAHDRTLLRELLDALPVDRTDAKTRALADLLAELGNARRVIFTGFAESAIALFEALPQDGVALLHGTGARLASGPASRTAILERFAPLASGARAPPPREAIHTLIATDVLSEGLDLQDANHCISYDLPWNPVRLMQRAGRIDRLGSPHDDVFVWYFEPPDTVERWIGLMRRLGIKLRTIAGTVGAEHGAVADCSGVHIGAANARDRAAETRTSGEATAPALAELNRLVANIGSTSADVGEPATSSAGRHGRSPDVVPSDNAVAIAAIEVNTADFSGLVAALHDALPWPPAESGALMFRRWTRAGVSWVECIAQCGDDRTALAPAVTVQAITRLGELIARAPYGLIDHQSLPVADLISADGPTMASNGGRSAGRAAQALRVAMAREGLSLEPTMLTRAERILSQLQRGAAVGLSTALVDASSATSLGALLDGLEATLGMDSALSARLDTVVWVRPGTLLSAVDMPLPPA